MKGGQEVKDAIHTFAVEKLLCRPWRSDLNPFTTQEKFAVMSRRLALDFDTSTLDGSSRREAEQEQMVQVEKHMRVCLGIRKSFESVVTTASSEPILSEAAGVVMQRGFSSCRALQDILQWPGMSKGDRGELIASNIIIDTLDSLMFSSSSEISPIVEVTSFFRALFADGIYERCIMNAKPSNLRHASDNKTFAETHKDSRIYVTHLIKVYDSSVLSIEFIVWMAARGVGIVCMDNQVGADIILPVLFRGVHLNKDAMTAFIIQVKNDAKFSVKPQRYLFSAMNPFLLGIFDRRTQTDPPPVIRMVFALAAAKPVVKLIQLPSRPSLPRTAKEKSAPRSAYTSFDIWCGHTSSSTFRVIKETDNEVYSDLLKRSKQVPDMFATDPESIEETTRSMYPCATAKAGHWSSFYETAAAPISSGFSIDDSSNDGGSDVDEAIDERENSDGIGHPGSRGDTELDIGCAVGEPLRWFILVSLLRSS
jgi:hypothetical protein